MKEPGTQKDRGKGSGGWMDGWMSLIGSAIVRDVTRDHVH